MRYDTVVGCTEWGNIEKCADSKIRHSHAD